MPGFVVNGLGEGARSNPILYYKYLWEIDLILGTTPTPGGALVFAREATTPSWDFDVEEIQGGSLKYKFAKSVVFTDIKITWYDVYGLAKIIKDWRSTVWTPDGGFADPQQYKTSSRLVNFTYDVSGKTTWELINSWPRNVKTGDLVYTDSDVKLVEVTVSYDWAVETEGDAT